MINKVVTTNQLVGVAYGFTFGFGFFVAKNALRQTHKTNTFIVLVWIELTSCLVSSSLVFLFLNGVLPPSLPLFVILLFAWAAQLQILLQIIVNRIALIWCNERQTRNLKWGIALWTTLINISVFCIWLPARLGVSRTFIKINHIWDPTEKVIYLLTDGSLNFLFVRAVRKSLVSNGLTKYKRLADFNTKIIFLSLALDCSVIGLMCYPKNSLLYVQFHPLVAIVKLNIELEMSNLIVAVVKASQEVTSIKETHHTSHSHSSETREACCVDLYP